MNYLWDTSILVNYIRRTHSYAKWESEFNFFHNEPEVFLAIVTLGEIYSMGLQRNWGRPKLERLESVVNRFQSIPIARKNIIEAYAQIDAYSQGNLAGRPMPAGLSARNMGKNDLWIGAIAHVHDFTLITTDSDFLHLDREFIKLIHLKA